MTLTHSDLHIRLGPPGTGKTTDLLGEVERLLSRRVKPWQIGFLAFTKKAANEAIERACKKFGLRDTALPHFRTIHSAAFRALEMSRDRMMSKRHYRDLGQKIGVELKPPRKQSEDSYYGMQTGDRILYLEGLARVTQKPLERVWRDADEIDISFGQLQRVRDSLAAFKRTNGLLDYTDLLELFIQRDTVDVPDLDTLFIDEGQDLSALQWQCVVRIAARAKRTFVAGDDDQAIYRWAGADVEAFMGLRGDTRVLGQSYRVPLAVHAVAARIVQRIRNRAPKEWAPRKEAGLLRRYATPEAVDLSQGTWLLLARNGYMLRDLEDLCTRRGFSFTSVDRNPLDSPSLKAIMTWERLRHGHSFPKLAVDAVLKLMSPRHCPESVRAGLRGHSKDKPVSIADLIRWGLISDPPIWHEMLDEIGTSEREFFIAARRRGETLTGTPRIRISTIHTAKGGEADNVLLLTDMSKRTYNEMERRADDEARVWYVAVTRARNALHVIQPQGANSFQI